MSGDHASRERHRSGRAAWLRAGVLGANDGLISTSALMVGVAAANSSRSAVLVAGIAGLTAGALAMAAGEYVSVSSQLDVEKADLAREREELATQPDAEREELMRIYRARGLSDRLAREVAEELSNQDHDRLAIHARDELGIDPDELARPIQASLVSAVSFTLGAVIPIIVMALSSRALRVPMVMAITLAGLLVLGFSGAQIGGAPKGRAALRVLIGGVAALGICLVIGKITGSAV